MPPDATLDAVRSSSSTLVELILERTHLVDMRPAASPAYAADADGDAWLNVTTLYPPHVFSWLTDAEADAPGVEWLYLHGAKLPVLWKVLFFCCLGQVTVFAWTSVLAIASVPADAGVAFFPFCATLLLSCAALLVSVCACRRTPHAAYPYRISVTRFTVVFIALMWAFVLSSGMCGDAGLALNKLHYRQVCKTVNTPTISRDDTRYEGEVRCAQELVLPEPWGSAPSMAGCSLFFLFCFCIAFYQMFRGLRNPSVSELRDYVAYARQFAHVRPGRWW